MRTKEQRCLRKEGQMRLRYTRSPKIRSGNDPQSTERTSKIRSYSNNENTEENCVLECAHTYVEHVNRSEVLDRGHLQEDSKITFNSVLFLLSMFLYPQRA